MRAQLTIDGMDRLDEIDAETALALLTWQVELGVDCAVEGAPVDRYALGTPAPKAPAAPKAPPPVEKAPEVDPVQVAHLTAQGAPDLATLADRLAAYPHCSLRLGARSTVFADGRPEARVMVIGEAPGREEDRAGKPFVGQAGQLLDRMFAAIGMARDHADAERAIYITNVLPWRPPQNRDPNPDEVAMMMPFLRRHVELAAPDLIVLMGNHACNAALGQSGITRLRGAWVQAFDRPALPMFHPAYLLRNPAAKRAAWSDLLALKERLNP